jgi:phosphatidylserine decarboxylase
MRIHREGLMTILLTLAALLLVNLFLSNWFPQIQPWLVIGSGIFFLFILQFFRNPRRPVPIADEQLVYSPADGKIVVIEMVEESEYFHDKRIMVSVFMSPLNVHINRVPFSGKVEYNAYHPGKYLAAWHPKASTENERSTVVLQGEHGTVLIRQIAGAVARRIVTYLKAGDTVQQGQQLGFIKFGSRADIFLPADAAVQVRLGQRVRGNVDVIASFG